MDQLSLENDRKIYEILSDALENLTHYASVQDLMEMTGLTKFQIRASIKPAKDSLAEKGIPIVNKFGYGYCHGTMEDQEIEMAKSSIRAYHAVRSQYRRSLMIRAATGYDFGRMEKVLANNTNSIKVIIRQPTEFPTVEDYELYLSKLKVTPDFLSEIANQTL